MKAEATIQRICKTCLWCRKSLLVCDERAAYECAMHHQFADINRYAASPNACPKWETK